MGTRMASQKAWLSRKAPEASCRDTCVWGKPLSGPHTFQPMEPQAGRAWAHRAQPFASPSQLALPTRGFAGPPDQAEHRHILSHWCSPRWFLQAQLNFFTQTCLLSWAAEPTSPGTIHCGPQLTSCFLLRRLPLHASLTLLTFPVPHPHPILSVS